MNKHHPYQNIIENKLEQLPAANADILWNEMHSILDKKMPQKKERRRFMIWFFISTAFLLLALVFGSILSTKKNSSVSIKKTHSSQPEKFIEGETVKISQGHQENTTSAKESNKRTRDYIFETTHSTSADDYVIDNDFVLSQTREQLKKYDESDQFNQSIPSISNDKTNLYNTKFDLKPIQQGFPVTSKYNVEKEPLSQQTEFKINKAKPNTKNKNENGFYTGVVAGVDLSSIHFKSIKTGASKGLIIGYAFNKKWSIESGLLWDTKRIYDDGSYFKPTGYIPTNGIKIVEVNGKCRLYELPVNIKYTIVSGKHSLFTTAGVSSYIMRSENYDYRYTQNNQPGGRNYLNYSNEKKNWFSVVNFSLGYTHKLGERGSIRVEPYLRIPIKNIGAGNMPVMSTGLNIGLTKTLR